jgi:hypothetical protein
VHNYEGSIEDVLASGEYDSGDYVTVTYDEFADLIEQARAFAGIIRELPGGTDVAASIERHTNRPLHPVLGGKSPYSEFLPL